MPEITSTQSIGPPGPLSSACPAPTATRLRIYAGVLFGVFVILRTVRDLSRSFLREPGTSASNDVHGAWDRINVPRVPARTDTAQMISVQSFGDVTDQFGVRHSMAEEIFPSDADRAVSLTLGLVCHPARWSEPFGQARNFDGPGRQLVEYRPKLAHVTSPSQTSGMRPGRDASPSYVVRGGVDRG